MQEQANRAQQDETNLSTKRRYVLSWRGIDYLPWINRIRTNTDKTWQERLCDTPYRERFHESRMVSLYTNQAVTAREA